MTLPSLVIFDMDGVLAELDRPARLAFLAARLSIPAAELQRRIWDSDFEVSAEAGAFGTGEAYLAELNRRLDRNLSRADWIAARRDAMRINEATLDVARRVSRCCAIALLTNNGWLLKESLPQIVPPIAALFSARAHATCEFNARKPQPAVFERILERYATRPQDSVFIDDEPDNVAAARSVGMGVVHYAGTEHLIQSLRQLGVPL